MNSETKKIKSALRDVIDFELGLDVVSMGLIRNVEMDDDNVTITMILTSPMCPMASMLMGQVRERAKEVTDKNVEVVMGKERWNPDMMEEEARESLGI
jgi:metal-sulfur cluster biosynthetic enzyme